MWAVSSLGLLWKMLPQRFVSRSFCGCTFSLPLGKYLGVNSGSDKTMFTFLRNRPNCSPKWPPHFTFPPAALPPASHGQVPLSGLSPSWAPFRGYPQSAPPVTHIREFSENLNRLQQGKLTLRSRCPASENSEVLGPDPTLLVGRASWSWGWEVAASSDGACICPPSPNLHRSLLPPHH